MHNTLSFFTVFMCHDIKPDLVDSYLSGICQQLEPYFPTVRDICKSILCKCMLTGCKWLRCPYKMEKSVNYGWPYSSCPSLFIFPVSWWSPLYLPTPHMFLSLMQLGELTVSDDKSLFDHRKITSRTSVLLSNDNYHFFLSIFFFL